MRRPPRAPSAVRAALAVLLAVLLLLGVPVVASADGRGASSSSIEPHGASAWGAANVVFTGDLASDFPAGPIYVNSNASAWGVGNTISAFYGSYNQTYLFLGFQEVVTTNSLMVFVGNGAGGGQGTYNLTGLNSWGRSITFQSSVIDVAGIYFSGANTGASGYGVFQVLTPPSDSNSTPSDREVASLSDFSATNGAAEIAIPLSTVFPANADASENVTVSAFVVGSSGSWVGTGVPYLQQGNYNDGGAQANFLVNDTFRLPLFQVPKVAAQPINVAIVFNDHQPVYEIAGQDTYNLPWTEAHATAEYMEQALILREFPQVNITYELSGSLLWQLKNISTDPGFNDTWIQDAYLSYSQLNTSQNASLLSSLTGDWFSIPGYVFAFNEPAAKLYQQLDARWSSGGSLSPAHYEDAKVLWFLYEISTDMVEGRLGSAWMSPTIWALHNQTSFDQTDLGTILTYSQWLTGEVIPAFRAIEQGNTSGTDNTELFTSPFYHPLTPLLLTPSISGPSGSISKGVYTTDVLAQMNLSRDQFDDFFGQSPSGLYASELALSEAMVPLINESGAAWTLTDQWTLQQSGINANAWGDGATIAQLENLYTPYVVQGANGTSTDVFFRDAPLSNDWAFNYGDLPTATAIADILNYLKAIDNAVPVGDHPRTLVTLALDGENWQFLSPFADDGVPFLEGLYEALEQNRSFVHTVTPTQFLNSMRDSPLLLPGLSSVATGSWNQGSGGSAPFQSNPSLTQWSGYSAQDWMWVDLNQVRGQVVAFQQKYGLVQLQNLTAFDQNLSANTPEGNVTRAWYGIYNAEGSDWTFQMAPWTISGANTVPFNLTFQGDLNYSLSELHPLSPPTISSFTASPSSVISGDWTNLTVVASGGTGVLRYAYSGLPPGCSSANLATLACRPTTAGDYSVRVYVNDSAGLGATLATGLIVTSPVVQVSITGVSVAPLSSTVLEGGTTSAFVATPACSSTCPATGISFEWSLSQPGWGTFSSPMGSSTTFTAGDHLGTPRLFVNASLNGNEVQSEPVPITISAPQSASPPTIVSFTVNPATVQVDDLTSVQVTATGGTGPLSYRFTGLPPGCASENVSSLGCTPTATGSFVLWLFVNDSLGHGASASTPLTVSSSPPTIGPNRSNNSTLFGLPTTEAYVILAGLLLAVAVVVVAWTVVRRRPKDGGGQGKEPSKAESGPAPESPEP